MDRRSGRDTSRSSLQQNYGLANLQWPLNDSFGSQIQTHHPGMHPQRVEEGLTLYN